jgi:probable addiction module antidote protein
MPPSRPYKVGLNERLKEPEYAAAYLNAAKKESQEVFLLALRDVAEVHKISKVAAAAGVNRETLYRTLSVRGNPTLASLEKILGVLGLEPEFRARAKRKRNAPLRNVPAPAVNVPNSGVIEHPFIRVLGQIGNVPTFQHRFIHIGRMNTGLSGHSFPLLAGQMTSVSSVPPHLLANTNDESSGKAQQ